MSEKNNIKEFKKNIKQIRKIIEEAFRKYCDNSSGYLQKEQMEQILFQIIKNFQNENITRQEVNDLVDQAYYNGDKITRDQFCDLIENVVQMMNKQS